MARVWICGFETGDFSECAGNSSGSSSVQGTTVRTGGYAAKFPTGGAAAFRESKTGLNLATSFARFYLNVASFPSTERIVLSSDPSSDVDIIRLYLTTAGKIKVTNFSTGSNVTLGTGTAVLNTGAGVWNLIEVKTVISAGSGIVEVLVNGVTDQTYTGLTNNARGNVDRYAFGPGDGDPGVDEYFDDLAIDDAAYCGAGRIIARQPKTGGTPTYNQYTKSTGTDGGALWDNTPFTTADFCSDATNAHAQTGVISLFSTTQSGHGSETIASGDTVNAVKVWLVGKTSATTSSGALASIRRRVNGTDTDTAITLTTSDAYYETAIFTTTVANLDLLEAGALHGNSTRTHTIEDVGVIVEYTPGAVSVSVTGQSVTASAGTVSETIDSNVSVTGQSITCSAGTVVPSVAFTVAGIALTASAGTAIGADAKPVTGQSATASAGAVVPSVAAFATGPSVTASAGTIVPKDLAIPSGQSISTSAGTVSVEVDKTFTGVALTASAGTIVASLAVAIVGPSVTASAGAITPALSALLIGPSSATAFAGAVAASITAFAAGQSITLSAGTIGPLDNAILSGLELAASTGTVTPIISISFAGQSATANAGIITASIAAFAAQSDVTASVGTIDAADSTPPSGLEIAASAGTIIAAVSASISGIEATASAGSVVSALDVLLAGQSITAFAGQVSITSVASGTSVGVTGQTATVIAGAIVPSVATSPVVVVSDPILDENGLPILDENGEPIADGFTISAPPQFGLTASAGTLAGQIDTNQIQGMALAIAAGLCVGIVSPPADEIDIEPLIHGGIIHGFLAHHLGAGTASVPLMTRGAVNGFMGRDSIIGEASERDVVHASSSRGFLRRSVGTATVTPRRRPQ